MPKIKKTIDGKEVEIELSVEELAAAGGAELEQSIVKKVQPAQPQTAEPKPTPKQTDTGPLQRIVDLDERMKTLEGGVAKLVEAHEQNVKLSQEQSASQLQEKAKTKAEELFKAGKIPKEHIDEATKRLVSDFDGYSAVYEMAGGKPTTKGGRTKPASTESTKKEPSTKTSGSSAFTHAEIQAMTDAEYEENREEIMKAAADDMIIE